MGCNIRFFGSMDSGYTWLRFEGVLDVARLTEFSAAFRGVPKGEAVLIDLRRVRGLDSVFLSELLLFKRQRIGRLSVVIAPSGPVARLFAIAGFGAKLDVFTDEAEAIAALGNGRRAETVDGQS